MLGSMLRLAEALDSAGKGRKRTLRALAHQAERTTCVTQLPAEALPLLCALSVAEIRRVLTEKETVDIAASFAVFVTESTAGDSSILTHARALGREILIVIQLLESYPCECKDQVRSMAKKLVISMEADTIDALWIACGDTTLLNMAHEIGVEPPQSAAQVSSDFIEKLLVAKYESERDSMASALSRHFSCMAGRAWAVDMIPETSRHLQVVDTMRQGLPKASFWKARELLMQDADLPDWLNNLAPNISEADRFVELLRGHVACDFALCAQDVITLATDSLASEEGGAPRRPSSSGLSDVCFWRPSEVSAPEVPSIMELEEAPGNSLVAAVIQAKAPLAHMSAPAGRLGQLQVDVLVADGLKSPDYRVGDLSASLLRRAVGGAEKLHPYVEVSCNGVSGYTRVMKTQNGRAEFGESIRLDFHSIAGGCPELTLAAFDARGVQQVIRGDPLIGRGTTPLDHLSSEVPEVREVCLTKNHQSHGTLRVKVAYVAPQSAYDVLANTKDRPLSEVAMSLIAVLTQAQGINALLRARPWSVDLTHPNEAALRQAVEVWVNRLAGQVQQLADADEEAVARRMANVLRSAERIVAMCVNAGMCSEEEVAGADVQDLTLAWILNLLKLCAAQGPDAQPPVVDEARLRRLLEVAAQPPQDDLSSALQAMGVALSKPMPEPVIAAIVDRLRTADEYEEEDIFTSDPIMRFGTARPNLGAVIRQTRAGTTHVFLYDYEHICRWVEERKSDPSTREHLSTDDIIKLVPAAWDPI